MAVTLEEYCNELLTEIGNLPTFAKAHRAHQLATFLIPLIKYYKLDEEIDLRFINALFEDSSHEPAAPIKPATSQFRSRTQKESQALTDLVGMAVATNQVLNEIGVEKRAKFSEGSKVQSRVLEKAPTQELTREPYKRPPRTEEQKAQHREKMRRYRALAKKSALKQ